MVRWVDVSKQGLSLERCEDGRGFSKNNEVVEVVEMGFRELSIVELTLKWLAASAACVALTALCNLSNQILSSTVMFCHCVT
jgi:hypothetical protein